MQFTNCTTREPLFHELVLSRLKCSVTNDMHVTIDPRPVQSVNHCFTICTGRTSRTSRVKPFTGRICLTVLDKDVWSESQLSLSNNDSLCRPCSLQPRNQSRASSVFFPYIFVETFKVTKKPCLFTQTTALRSDLGKKLTNI